MNAVFQRIGLWFWYLLPANPILVRVVYGASRRPRHLWLRAGYLAAILFVVLINMSAVMSAANASLTDLAKGASRTFQFAATVQLALMCFLAPVFTAGAITQERDSQTMNILLATPLTNGQIVIGSLMSRLYFVFMLLLAGLPIFLMTLVYGGVTRSRIFESFALSGSTAFLTGALAIYIAMLGVGTRRTMFSFYMLIALYLLTLYALATWPATWVDASPPNIRGGKMSWLAPLHPFLSLEVALNRLNAPPYGHLADRSALVRYALAYPSTAYVVWTTLAGFVLVVLSMFLVRRGSKIGESTLADRLFGGLRTATMGERKRKARNVWHNPVAWREAKTRAFGGVWLRGIIIAAGAVGSVALLIAYLTGSLSQTASREWLAALIAIQFGIVLVIAGNTSATALTKEKEARTLDLLLTTPLTSQYILWGKLRGLVSFVAPLLIVPVAALTAFGLLGHRHGEGQPTVWIECAIELAALMTLYTAGACVIGLKISMTARKNVVSVMYSVGTVVLICVVLWGIGYGIVTSVGGEFAAFFMPFSPFSAIVYLTNPVELFDSVREFQERASSARFAATIGSALAVIVVAAIVWSSYSGLVRGFDMTMRKQTGTN
jgi:ABC-type transport system involved in multi-copper enzyme maturation permease subunit